MDRVSQLRGAAGSSQDSTLDTTAPPSEAYMTANESSSKYFSLSEEDSEVDSTFEISSMKVDSLATANAESESNITNTEELITNLSPISKNSDILDSYKIGKQIEAANILSGGVDIFEDNENSYDGDELVIDDNVMEDKSEKQDIQGDELEPLIHEEAGKGSKDSEVVLQIDGKNVDAIDIGNGLYLYRKEGGQEELAAVQIIDDDQQQTSFKFLKVRENAEGNLEVYEEFEIEVPAKQAKAADKSSPSKVPIKEIDVDKVVDRINKSPKNETTSTITEEVPEEIKDELVDTKTDPNFNSKMKFSESRKSPVIGSFTPMTFHSTPNKEGKPLTKTMVDQQLHPNRHSDNIKKTIEVHTDNIKQKSSDTIKIDNTDNKTEENYVILDEKLGISEEKLTETELVSEIKNIPEEKALEVIENNEKEEDETKISTSSAKSNEIFVDNVKDDDHGDLRIVEQSEEKTPETTENIKDDDDGDLRIVEQSEEETPEKSENAKDDDDGDLRIVEQCGEETPEKSEIVTEVITYTNNTQVESDKQEPVGELSNVVIEDYSKNKEVEVDMLEVNDKNTNTEDKSNEVASQNLVTDGSINKHTEENIGSETAVISISDMSPNNDNLGNKSVEINLDDKDDAKIEEGILIIDEDNAEGTVLTIDDIINDTQSINNEVKSMNIQSNTQIAKNIQICVQSSEKPNLTLLAAVSAREKITNAPAHSTQEKDIEKTTNVLKEVNDLVIPVIITNKDNIVLSQSVTKTENVKIDDIKMIDSDIKDITKVEDLKKIPDPTPLEVVNVTVANQVTLPPPNLATVKSTKVEIKSHVDEKKSTPSQNFVSSIPIVNNKGSALPKSETPIQVQPKETLPKEISTDKRNISKDVDNKQKLKIEKSSQIKPDTTTIIDSKNQTIKTKAEPNEKNVDKIEPKAVINLNTAVPFGQWTEANRQEFLNKFKSKVPVTTSSSNQLKNSNDLNRRDVLKKIDSQRQTSNALSKNQDSNKPTKNEQAFSSKANKEIVPETKVTAKNEKVEVKPEVTSKPINSKTAPKTDSAVKCLEPTTTTMSSANKKESAQRTEVTMTDLIDKTVEDMIHNIIMRPTKASQEEPKHNAQKDTKVSQTSKLQSTNYKLPNESVTLDAIEMKMNELHGIPFIERPPHELPKVIKNEVKNKSENTKKSPSDSSKTTKIPNLLPFTNKTQVKIPKDQVIEVDSEEEVIEHPPVTGDINLIKKIQPSKSLAVDTFSPNTKKETASDSKSDAIITEKDFDKFVRRNSITYENRLTVNFDGKEQHNVVQSVVERDPMPKTYSKNSISRLEVKPKLAYNQQQTVYPLSQQTKFQPVHMGRNTYGSKNEDNNRNQSKLQKAYQSVLTAKRQKESPITIIEDKPVKVVFMDNVEYVPRQLNAQGQELSPAKKPIPESEVIISTCDSVDTDIMDDMRSQDEIKSKNKHQRKQVLTPVDEPESELIEPKDLQFETSPKKKRKVDDDKNLKYPVRKKFFQYSGSNEIVTAPNVAQIPHKDSIHRNDEPMPLKDTVSAIDSLVKAAELLETQTENSENSFTLSQTDSPQTTPVKRGRGRPRKYPLPEGASDKKAPSPQKKPRLIDAKPQKRDTTTDEDDSDDEQRIIKENWTMGKINENIVCPICNKLFRSENVVFKHVKHCTGPSPNRSESDKQSPRRMRQSQESESKSFDSKSDDMDLEDDEPLIKRATPKNRKSNDSATKSENREDVIVIEDTPDKDKTEKMNERKQDKSRKLKAKTQSKNNDLVCEFCGKSFRQLSYLVSHKLQHKKEVSHKLQHKKDEVSHKLQHKKDEVSHKLQPKKDEVSHKLQHKKDEVSHKLQPKKDEVSYKLQPKKDEVSHKLQHKNDDVKKIENDNHVADKSVYCCEVCKKEFRKLHHLVQHRIIHNPASVPNRSHRKSSEKSDNNTDKQMTSKNSEDPSAGFRCEPCDKSFRKLHHLVEHRETHDGINSKQKVSVTPQAKPDEDKADKSLTTHQCEVCKKSFRKLHHLIEHKDQHLETSSEKSDDKSVKSCLSTRDIIHECSLCYMVFPNEHSLTKHTVICQRKKRQSKQMKPANETAEETSLENTGEKVDVLEPIKEDAKEVDILKNDKVIDKSVPTIDQKQDITKNKLEKTNEDEDVTKLEIVRTEADHDVPEKDMQTTTTTTKTEIINKVVEKPSPEKTPKEIPKQKLEIKPKNNENNKSENALKEIETVGRKVNNKSTVDSQSQPTKRDFKEVKDTESFKTKSTEVPQKIKKIEPEIIEIEDTPKKKTPLKEKLSAAKRVKASTSTNDKEVKPPAESSDDDEIRYMFNPNLKTETVTEEKVFMKVRANKRSSLQIERPNSKDLMKRRTSLQHPPKIPRHKPKTDTNVIKNEPKTPKQEPVPSTDSDDSETTKYSFPTVVEKTKTLEKAPKDTEAKAQKKSIAEKRKSLSGIAKRKSLGKAVIARHKPSPLKTVKKRTLEIEHRCDCGQLFSSAALLSRHTTLAHTPPRIRRRRSPPPEQTLPAKTVSRKSNVTDKPKQTPVSRKSSVKSDTAASTKDNPKPARKSVSKEVKTNTDKKAKQEDKSETKSSVKLRSTGAHKGVPVPEKMRKLMQKNKLSSL